MEEFPTPAWNTDVPISSTEIIGRQMGSLFLLQQNVTHFSLYV